MTIGEEFAAKLEGSWRQYMDSMRQAPSVMPTNRASMLGDVCERRLVLWRTKGDEAAPIEPELQSIFEEGNLHEREVKRLLAAIGFDIIGSQQSFPKNDYNISGHIDGLLEYQGVTFVVEVKSVNPNDWARIKSINDIRYSTRTWMKKWFDQAQLYCFLKDISHGIFILKNKSNGQLKILAWECENAAVEFLLDRACRIEEHIKAQTLPPTIDSPSECTRCAFFERVCFPSLTYGPGSKLIADEDILEMAQVREKNERAHRIFEEVDAALKERLRGVERAFIGTEFMVQGRWQKKTTMNIPKEIKDQYSTVDPKGMFVLKIEKLNPEGEGANGAVEVEGS